MKLLYDFDIFHRQNYGGISKYHAEVIKGLKKYHDIEISFPLLYNENRHLNIGRKNYIEKINKLSGNRITKSLSKVNQLLLNRELKKKDFDIYITTYYNTTFLNLINGKPFVLTVLDMIHELYPMYFTKDKTTVNNKYKLIQTATRIITISNNTKNDILKLYPDIDENKIDVVYLGYSNDNLGPKSLKIPKDYILFVGQRADYKNFNFFFESVKNILINTKDLYLICTGPEFTLSERKIFLESSLDDRIIHISTSDAELIYLYQNALCFVFPSLYEGFGIPAVEAMANRCPLIVSHSGSYFEIGNILSLTQSIEKVINNSEYRNELINKGLIRSQIFTWENTVRNFYNTLKKICP